MLRSIFPFLRNEPIVVTFILIGFPTVMLYFPYFIYCKIVSPKVIILPEIESLIEGDAHSISVDILARYSRQALVIRFDNYENDKHKNSDISSKTSIFIETTDKLKYEMKYLNCDRVGLNFGFTLEENKKIKKKSISKITLETSIYLKNILLKWESHI